MDLEGQLEWIVAKIKTLRDYHTPTDNRDRDGEIKGWLHVLCSSHESLHRWLGEFKETRAEVERLKAEIQDAKDFHKRVVGETCNVYEKHCTCVPVLRLEQHRLTVDNAKLREALEKHGVHTSVDCTYGQVISSPDRPQKPCVCGLEEALKVSQPEPEPEPERWACCGNERQEEHGDYCPRCS